MFKASLFLLCFIRLLFCCLGGELPEGTPDRTTVCAGTPIRSSCPSGEVIAVKHIQYGTKETCTSAGCCDFDANDCFIDYKDTAQQAACSGKEVCNEITIAQSDTSSCGDPYPNPGLNNYLTMEYYCIPDSRINNGVSDTQSIQLFAGTLAYLHNKDYPNPIRADTFKYSCSVEANTCRSQIKIYFLHFELDDGGGTCPDNQKIKINDELSVHTYTCSENTNYEITLMMTSTSNYISVELENTAGVNRGKFWLGFEATDTAASLRIDGPVRAQTYCKDCDWLESPSNCAISYSDNTTYQSVATFSCSTGYTLEGSSTRECQIYGNWSNESPSCNINDCGSLSDPLNGLVTNHNGTTYQSVATYTCSTGYTLSGDATRICQADKNWSNDKPTCEINDCGNLTDPANGLVAYNNGTTYQSVVSYSCDTGYTLSANTTRMCQADKNWSNIEPTCEINDCGNLTDPANGLVTNNNRTTYQSIATYSCDTGYTLSGDATRVCQADKNWSSSEPTCEINDCGTLAKPANGLVTHNNGTTYQSVATYSCNTGYTLSGDATRICQANKNWSNSEPRCEINDCGTLTSPLNGLVTYHNGTTYQSVAAYSCSTGYTLSDDVTRICQADKNWSNDKPTCEINDCGNLTDPANGLVIYNNGTTYQSVATYSCSTGYTLSDDVTRLCQADKNWSNNKPTCEINDCGNLTDPANGLVVYNNGTTYQSVAKYSCSTGYTLSDNVTRICQADKNWSNDKPTCEINNCGNLTDPANGLVVYNNGTTYQSVATYSCSMGYSLSDDVTRLCQADKNWSNTKPTCDISDCGNLTDPANGLVIYKNGTTYQSVATYSCSTGYTLSDDVTRLCQADKNWSNNKPTCKINDCGNLTDPTNGFVVYKNGTTYQSVVTYSCDTGYTLSGDTSRMCQADKNWSNSEPICEINDCGNLTDPANGLVTLDNGTTYQSVATYSCDTGYTLSGDATRMCQANKNWSNSQPICKINDCGTLSEPPNGSVTHNNGTTYQSVATYGCNTGYTLSGDATRICQADKSWSNSEPRCKINDCGNLTDPANGLVAHNNGTTYQSVVIYACDTGYTLSGDTSRMCQADKKWSNSQPTCEINDCGNLTDPANGLVTHDNGTTYQSVATYSCDTGYTLGGDATRMCQDDKNWSNNEPICEINDCGTLAEPPNGSVTHGNGTTYQSVATYSCNTGYTLRGDATRICQADKSWSNSEPKCEINDCGTLAEPANGSVTHKNGTTYQSVATYSCNTGFTLSDNETRICQADKSWSNSEPRCEINDCGNLTNPLNGLVTNHNGTTYQSVATYSCSTGYTISDDATRICQADKNWSNNKPTCKINDCGNLTDPANGLVAHNNGTTYQSVVTYSCDTGYTLSGETTRTCQADKNWSNSEPTCEINDCGNLTDPINGLVTHDNETTYQSVATYSCDTGYTLSGNATRICQAGKNWSYSEPICEINDCGNLDEPPNGSVTHNNGTTYQSVATYSCNTGYTLVGDGTRICQADKSWSNSEPKCEINDCGSLISPLNGLVTNNGTTYQSVATYSCSTGYTLSGGATRICQADKNWSNNTPTCEINGCGNLTDPANGIVVHNNGTTYQSVVTYSCDTGYTLSGETTRTCQADKRWSNSESTCEINDCGNLTNPTNGVVTPNNGTTYQSVVIYSCGTGYTLSGDTTRMCQADKNWSNNEPICEINDCGHLTDPANGLVTRDNGTTYQSVATYSCDTGYTLSGDAARMCKADKKWSNSEPTCEINDCGLLKNSFEGSVTYSNGTTFQSVATFNCEPGFMLQGVSTRICLANKLWSDSDPTCVMSASLIIGICIGSSAAIAFLMLLLYLLFKYLLLRRSAKSLKTPIKSDPEDRCIFNSNAESCAAKDSKTEELRLDDYPYSSPGLKQAESCAAKDSKTEELHLDDYLYSYPRLKQAAPQVPIAAEEESVASNTDLKPPVHRDDQDDSTINS